MIKRKYVLFVLSCAALMGAMVAALATIQQRDFDLRGYVDATRTHDLPFRVARLGVNAELTQYTPEALRQQLDLMQQMGITWVRQFVRWDEIEPTPGQYQWAAWDDIIKALDTYPDLALVAVLVAAPDWAAAPNSSDGQGFRPPDDPQTFAEFAAAFAGRYALSIHHYQIWDEPNIKSGWGNHNPRVTAYAALLQAAYRAIHNADSSATVIAAALAPTVETGPENYSDISYSQDLYALGLKDFSDALAAKPYGFDLPPDDRRVSNEVLNFSRIIALREVMVQNGDAQKALWAAHWGWNSLPNNWAGAASIWGQVSAAQQLNYTLQALERAEREWPWLGGMILHHWQPDAAPHDPQWGFALIDQQNTPSPLLTALMAHAAPSSTHAANGLYPARNPYARYSGTWAFSDFGADIGWVQDSAFSFDFAGRDLALLIREGDYVAHFYPRFYPQIEEVEINALPRDVNGNPFLLLRSADLQPRLRLVPVARDLPNTAHTLRVTADELIPDEALSRWPLVGYAVSDGYLATPYNRQITLAWVTVVIATLSVGVTGWRLPWGVLLARFDALWRLLGNVWQISISALASLALLMGMFITWGDGLPTFFRRDSVQIGLSLLSAGLIYIDNFGVVLTIIAALALFVIVYHRLELGLMLVVFWMPFFLFPVELYRFAFPMAELILLITVAAWLLRLFVMWGHRHQGAAAQRPPKVRFNPFDYAVAAWVLLGLLSLFWAERRGLAITELRTLIIQPALFYVVFRSLHPNRKTVLLLVDALLLAGFTVAVVGLFMWLRGESVITAEDGARRLASVYGSPNNVGLLIGRCLPFVLAFLVLKPDRRRWLFAGAVLVVMLPAVVLSQSAGALFIGIPAATAALMLLIWGRRALLPLFGLLVILVIGMFIALQSPRFSRLVSFTEGTNFYRVRVWQSALNMIEDYPLTGVGLDQFLYEFRGTYIMPDAWEEPELSHPHNIILDFWVRLGVMGVVWLLILLFFFWKWGLKGYRHYREKQELYGLALGIGALGSMVNLLAHGLVDNSVFVLDLAYIFMLLIGINATLLNMGAIDENLQ